MRVVFQVREALGRPQVQPQDPGRVHALIPPTMLNPELSMTANSGAVQAVFWSGDIKTKLKDRGWEVGCPGLHGGGGLASAAEVVAALFVLSATQLEEGGDCAPRNTAQGSALWGG